MHGRMRGLTLLEALITLTIVSITAGIAIPTMTTLMAEQQLTSSEYELTHSLMLARSHAIHLRKHVVVCPSGEDWQCSKSPSWNQGWLIFEDDNQNRKWDNGEYVIQQMQSLPDGVSAESSRYRRQVRYTPDGYAPGTNLTIQFCHKKPIDGRRIIVSNAGRARQHRTDGSECGHSL